jgi:hypothetical protein
MLCFFRVSLHPVPSTSLSCCRYADVATTHYTDSVSDHPVLKDSSPKPYCLNLQERRMNHCSTVGSSGDEALVLVHLCLNSNEVSDRPTVSSLRPSDHSVLQSSAAPLLPIIWRIYKMDCRFIRRCQLQFCLLLSVPSTLTLASMVPSVHPMVSFLFPSFLVFDPWKIDYHLACGIFLHPWDLETSTKTC